MLRSFDHVISKLHVKGSFELMYFFCQSCKTSPIDACNNVNPWQDHMIMCCLEDTHFAI